MTMYSLISPGGSPGVTTTALALALTWSRPVIVAECDPGGGDVLAGLFAGHLSAPRGLLGVAFEAGVGGYFSPYETADNVRFDAWAATVDLRAPLGRHFEMTANAFNT